MYKSNLKDVIKEIDVRLEKTLLEICLFLEAETKTRTPVLTGMLRNSYKTKTVDENTKQVGTSVPYSIYVELGTRFQRAQPHLYPAYSQNRSRIEQIISKNMGGKK